MLFHLPIVILTTLSPVAIFDMSPRFDIAKECRLVSLRRLSTGAPVTKAMRSSNLKRSGRNLAALTEPPAWWRQRLPASPELEENDASQGNPVAIPARARDLAPPVRRDI